MDLLDRVNALTDDQLRMIADRDDASGVLAAYRLAERRGLPMPDREAVILCDGYVIVAQAGRIMKVPTSGEDSVVKIIRQEGDQYCVYSADGSRSFGCYDSMAAAEERLAQIHSFSNAATPTKRENGMDFPAEAYAYVPDPAEPGTWALRVWESPEVMETREQIAVALGNLDSQRIPSSNISIAQEGIRRAQDRLAAREGASTRKETFVPPEGVQAAAQRALDWIAEGHAGGGFTDVGRARAAQLARGDAVSEQTIRRIAAYLSRHEGDSGAEGFSAGEAGFPSPGRVAWDAWGGDPAVSWSRSIVERLDRQEKNDDAPLTPRQRMMYEQYELVADMFGPWDASSGPDGAHYMDAADNPFTDAGLNCANCVFYEGGGGCEILNQPVEPGALCKLWIVPEGLVQEQAGTGHAKALPSDTRLLAKAAAQRFTLGPLYVPDFMDAHGEWTDAEELQNAVWGWVQSGDRTIYLQHDREVRAGEWVEVMTMPQPWTVQMMSGDGTPVGEVTYPAGTVFLGVIWDEGPWKDILAGNLRGYSIGGFSDRMLADLPTEAAREGVSMDA